MTSRRRGEARGAAGEEPRTLVLWCPDWPVIAADLLAGIPATDPVAVLHGNRVLACSPAARAEGVRRGLGRREAQSRCPGLRTVDHDPGRDTRAYEPVLAAVEDLAAGLEVLRPGVCALAVPGLARYHGGEERAAELLVEHVAQSCGVESQAGIADGVFAAGLAARTGRIVPPGGTPDFLARLPLAALGRPALVDLLRRLGLRTLGDFAALPAGDVLSRFGSDAAYAHRLAAGGGHRPLVLRRPPPDLVVIQDYDEPLDRVDTAAFAARSLAQRLAGKLDGHGLTCTRLVIEAVTAHGQELHRVWRHDGPFSPAGITDRVRWQLDGWLAGTRRPPGAAGTATPPVRPTAGIVRLGLRPDGVLPQLARQPGLWGEPGDRHDRARRALDRVQGLLGPEAVLTPVPGGGRTPTDRVRLVPWGDERTPARPVDPPWPGRLPPPDPAVVLATPLPVEVYDADGHPVRISARLEVSAAPATLVAGTTQPVPVVPPVGTTRSVQITPVAGTTQPVPAPLAAGPTQPVPITGWAGPWPLDERWWAPAEARRQARCQVLLADGTALLLALESGRWWIEAIYD